MAPTSLTWGLHPHSNSLFQLSSGSSVTAELHCRMLISSSVVDVPMPGCGSHWSVPQPVDWLPSLMSTLCHHSGPPWGSLVCAWPWLSSPELILPLTCGLTLQLGHGPVSLPWISWWSGLLVEPGCHLWSCLAHLSQGLWDGPWLLMDPALPALWSYLAL